MTGPPVLRAALAVLAVLAATLLMPAPAAADQVRDAQWHVDYLDLASAHRITRGDDVTVAIIDSGVDASHQDLRDNLLPGIDLIEPDNANAWTPEAHGTLVAGVLAGHGHGAGGDDGVLGIAPAATVLPIRASTDADHQPTSQLVAEGITRAVAAGASVVSISLSSDYSEIDERAIAAARRSDVVVVAAAGNRPAAEGVTFPAALSTVVAVGGVDQAGGLAEFSVTGPEVLLTAPGHEIVTTQPGGEYAVASGTSFAAPVVAGAAALLRAEFPELTADEVIHRLVTTAADAGPPGQDEHYGHGLIDVVSALTDDVPPMPPMPDAPDGVRLGQWHLQTLNLPTAHEITRGEDVTVALVGSGVDARHPDLHDNLLPGIDLVEPSNDHGWTPEATGTALAGLVAGHGNRLTDHEPGSRGTLGVAPAAAVLPVRVNGPDLADEQAVQLAIAGIEWAVAQGAQVICYSGGIASEDLFAPAIEAARAQDVLVVAAAAGPETGSEVWFPAANPAVVTALGTDRDGAAGRSYDLDGTGAALAAPGADLLTTAPDGGYAEAGGANAAAAAVVAGAAALVRAEFPELTADEVVHRLVTTATPAAGSPGTPAGDGYGHGFVDIVAALTADVPPPTGLPELATGGPAQPPPMEQSSIGPIEAVILMAAGVAAVLGTAGLAVHRVRERRPRPAHAAPDDAEGHEDDEP